jgi:hypothetical protein
MDLRIMRACAEMEGFEIGRITQHWSDETRGMASYTADILKLPPSCLIFDPENILMTLQQAWMSDVHVDAVSMSKFGTVKAHLTVRLTGLGGFENV